MKPIVFLLLGLFVFGLMACGGDSSSGSNGASLSNSAVIDEMAQTFTIYSPTCTYADGAVTFDEKGLTEFYNYSIDAGVLKLVNEDSYTIEFTGTSSTIMGTWKMSIYGVNQTINISENAVSTLVEYADGFCAMDEFEDSYADDSYAITKISCTEASVTIAENIVMTVKINEMSADGSYSFSFSYNGKTCTHTKNVTQVSASLCTVANYEAGYINASHYTISNATEYATCMQNMMVNEPTQTVVTKISKNLAKILSSAKK
jgi:hypothetical protein